MEKYRLYDNMAHLLLSDKEEFNIIKTMLEYYDKFDMYEFYVIKHTDRDEVYLRTRSEEDLLYYIENFESEKKVKKR